MAAPGRSLVKRTTRVSLQRRAIVGFALLWFLASDGAVPADAVEPGPGEAIVLAGCDDDGSLRALDFREYWQKDKFTLNLHEALSPQIVKAGRYSLHSFVPVDPYASPGQYSDPKNLADTFEIKAGSVTYIGDFKTRRDADPSVHAWTVTVSFHPELLLEAKQHFPWLMKYPLYMAKVGERAQPVKWE
jgi:hypothetical protein